MKKKSGKKKVNGRPFVPGDKRAGRPPGVKNKATVEAKEACTRIVDDEIYRANLLKRARLGRLKPAVEVMLWHYSKGKPKDTLELTGSLGIGAEKVIYRYPDNGRGPSNNSAKPASG